MILRAQQTPYPRTSSRDENTKETSVTPATGSAIKSKVAEITCKQGRSKATCKAYRSTDSWPSQYADHKDHTPNHETIDDNCSFVANNTQH